MASYKLKLSITNELVSLATFIIHVFGNFLWIPQTDWNKFRNSNCSYYQFSVSFINFEEGFEDEING